MCILKPQISVAFTLIKDISLCHRQMLLQKKKKKLHNQQNAIVDPSSINIHLQKNLTPKLQGTLKKSETDCNSPEEQGLCYVIVSPSILPV